VAWRIQLPAPFDCTVVAVVSTLPSSIAGGSRAKSRRDGFRVSLKSRGQPGTAAHLHPRREIEPLHVGRADIFRVGASSYHGPLHARDVTWGVAMRGIWQV
jgi:hypothetical protein